MLAGSPEYWLLPLIAKEFAWRRALFAFELTYSLTRRCEHLFFSKSCPSVCLSAGSLQWKFDCRKSKGVTFFHQSPPFCFHLHNRSSLRRNGVCASYYYGLHWFELLEFLFRIHNLWRLYVLKPASIHHHSFEEPSLARWWNNWTKYFCPNVTLKDFRIPFCGRGAPLRVASVIRRCPHYSCNSQTVNNFVKQKKGIESARGWRLCWLMTTWPMKGNLPPTILGCNSFLVQIAQTPL